jgi:5,10-methylenetetrahydromethanopterin reductase
VKLALALSGKRDTSDAVAMARMAETLGFAEIWITEDYCERGAFAVAGAVLASTSDVTVGIGVVNPWTRHSVVTAMETAALAELAPGRVVLGLGASNPRWMQDDLGIPFERPLGVLRDTTEVVRRLLTGADVQQHDGRHHIHTRLAFTPPRPVPLVLGVKGEQALRMAGRLADGVLLSVLTSPAYVRWARQRTGDIPLAAYVAFACDDRDPAAARERMRPFAATFLGIHGDHPITRVAGLDAETARAFRQGWLDGQPRVDLVDDDVLDRFVVSGSHDHPRRLVQRLLDVGLDTVVVHDQLADDTESYLTGIRAVTADLADPRQGVRASRA